MSDEIDCTHTVARALHWIDANIDAFDLTKINKPFDMRQGKRLIELAVMLVCYADLTGDRDNSNIPKMVRLLETTQNKFDLKDRLMRSPRMFGLFSDVYAVLRLLGHDNPEQRALIQRVIDAGFLDDIERVPHRLMDIRLSLEWGSFAHSWPTLEKIYDSSILSKVPCALYLDEGAIYALTHVIIFLYGCGVRKHVSLPTADLERLGLLLSALLVITCQERHWDLLGELLFCWDCIELKNTAVYERAWRAFLRTQMEDGAFPGPESTISASPSQDSACENQNAFFHFNYHTTIVAIMACAVHINRIRNVAAISEDRSDVKDVASNMPIRPSRQPLASSCAATAHGWLEQLMTTVEGVATTPPEAFCNILLGCWICDSMTKSTGPDFPGMAQRVWKALMACDDGPGKPFWEIPPALKLVVSAILFSEGLRVPSLDDYFWKTAEVLNATPADDPVKDVSLCEKRVLLHTVGLHGMPKWVDYSETMTYVQGLPLTAPAENIEDLLLRINSLTSYGTRQVALEPTDLWIQEFLVGLAMHFLRQYDFIMGCKLLRSMSYLGVGAGSSFDACIRFLYLHQRPEGAFGFFGPEEAKMKATMPHSFSAGVDLYLPVTLSCLVVVAESRDDNWRLYRALPRVPLRARSITHL